MQTYNFLLVPGVWFSTVYAAVFGLVFGSFLNVVIYRVPKMMQRESENFVAVESGLPAPHTARFNLVAPRSGCPHCGHKIRARENIPVVSYLFLRGKCSGCGARISPRYPAIEAFTAVLSALIIWHLGAGAQGMAALGFTYMLIGLAFIDIDKQLLPDDMTLPLLWAGLLINVAGLYASLGDAVIGAIAGYTVPWVIFWIFKLTTGKDAIGYGDFKLLAALGAWLGWQMIPLIMVLSATIALSYGLAGILGGSRQRDEPMPYGPYLCGAGLVAMMCGKYVMARFFAL